jgi:hypothetical protein
MSTGDLKMKNFGLANISISDENDSSGDDEAEKFV